MRIASTSFFLLIVMAGTAWAQDQQLALAIEESADSDTTVTTSREAWS